MRKSLPILLALMAFRSSDAGVERRHDVFVYRGTVGKSAVEFVLNTIDHDSQAIDGVYMYLKHHEPIPLDGTYAHHRLILGEAGGHRFVFTGFADSLPEVAGTWVHGKTKASLPVALHKVGDSVGVLQKKSLKTYFFRVSRNSTEDFQSFEMCAKKTGRKMAEATAHMFYEMDVIDFDAEEKNLILVRDPESKAPLFEYRLKHGGKLERICCDTSSDDSLLIAHPNLFRNQVIEDEPSNPDGDNGNDGNK